MFWHPVIRLTELEQIHHPCQVQDRDGLFGVGLIKGNFMFSVDLKDLKIVLKVKVYQLKALCFGLSIAPQVFTRVFALVSEWAYKRGI